MTIYRTLFRPTVSLVLFGLLSCDPRDPTIGPAGSRPANFENVPTRAPITPRIIDEASGLADSRTIPGYLWTHQDAGHPPQLILLSHDGKDIRTYDLPNASSPDWEDIAVGPGPKDGVSYIYVGDIGNNTLGYGTRTIYRVPELTSLEGQFAAGDVEQIVYQYPDGPRDAETLLLDPLTKDIFIISKELDKANIYRLAYPQSTDQVSKAELVGTIPELIIATGGDIADDGREVLIRTYTNVFYWRRAAGESVAQALTRKALKTLPYEFEPQGEAVCFDRAMGGYYTLSERRAVPNVTLNYYRRK